MSSSKPILGDPTTRVLVGLATSLSSSVDDGFGVSSAERAGWNIFFALFNVLDRAVNRDVAFFKAISTSMVWRIVSTCDQVVCAPRRMNR